MNDHQAQSSSDDQPCLFLELEGDEKFEHLIKRYEAGFRYVVQTANFTEYFFITVGRANLFIDLHGFYDIDLKTMKEIRDRHGIEYQEPVE